MIRARPSQGKKLSLGGPSTMKDGLDHGADIVPNLFIGKWTVKIMYLLKRRPQRHGQLRRGLGSVSQRMLTRTLRNLESAGLIARQVTRSNSVAVEYSLTKLGRTFIIPLSKICHWATRHHEELSAIARFSKRPGNRLRELGEL